MKIMLANPVATLKTHNPLQNKDRLTEAKIHRGCRLCPINMARIGVSTRV